jgi:DNA-binding beta-propeller fold protein YncE
VSAIQGQNQPMRLWAIFLVFLASLSTGCPASSEEARLAPNRFYFPTGLAVSPDQQHLFLTNANADLRFESGTLQVLDLARIDELVASWDGGVVPPGCRRDEDQRQSIICDEEDAAADFVIEDASVRLGNFVGEVRVQELESGQVRLFVPSRGDPSLTWLDFDPTTARVSCGGSERFARCDDDHRLGRLRDDLDLVRLGEEPFGIYVDGANGFVVLTHLVSGNVTLASAPTDGRPPVLTDVKGGFFASNPNTGLRGAVAAAGREPGAPSDLVYVTSRAESRVQTFYVTRPGETGLPLLAPADFFFLDAITPAEDTRGVAFSADGTRAHFINRRPPTLITVDTSVDALGRPVNKVAASAEICDQAGLVLTADAGQGELAYVGCFRDGEVWVVDPILSQLRAVVSVGRGPHAMAVSTNRNLIYVANFLENTVAVIDIRPGSITQNRVIVRLGEPEFGEEL